MKTKKELEYQRLYDREVTYGSHVKNCKLCQSGVDCAYAARLQREIERVKGRIANLGGDG